MKLDAKPTPISKRSKLKTNPYRPWAARFWHGMLLSAWLRLLRKNRFHIHPFRLGLTFTVGVAAIFNSLLRPVQRWLLASRIARTQIKDAPIFIIGHWRSGTTLLHELLVLDGRYTFPTTYACMAPNHFLITSWLIPKLLPFLIPSKRPMDNMTSGWDRPQEDEFALCNMGQPSPYLTMAFPNHPPQYPEYLGLDVPPAELQRWKDALATFLQCVTFRSPKRIILKSPPHTARIRVLLEMFPTARFVHIVRDPYAVFSSTMRLWKTFYESQALQHATNDDLDNYVFSLFGQMYEKFESDKHLIDPARFYEVRYEDLTRDPAGQMRALYDHLQLGEFELVRPKLQQYVANMKNYKANKHDLDPALCAEIDRRWGPFMRRYGYCGGPHVPTASQSPGAVQSDAGSKPLSASATAG